jgi:hypothetical protein
MRRYYERNVEGLGRIVLETRGLRPRVRRFAYCAADGRVFVSDDLALLGRISESGGDEAATYILETREQLDAGVVLTRGRAAGVGQPGVGAGSMALGSA